MTNQISLYSADLDIRTFFSEKGLKKRKMRMKFKFITSRNKENAKEPIDEKEAGSQPAAESKDKENFFKGISDSDRCFNILMLHNVKVQKILDERKYGIVSDRSPPKVEVKSKKKKAKKRPKKIAPIEVTIMFKGEDGYIEQMKVEGRDGKRKPIKKKQKSSVIHDDRGISDLSDSNNSEAKSEDNKNDESESTEEAAENSNIQSKARIEKSIEMFKQEYGDGEEGELEYLMSSHNESLLSLENKYMKMLESSYQTQMNSKSIKKVKIKSSIRIIQRAWRRHFQRSKLSKILAIQKWWRNIKKQNKARIEFREAFKSSYHVLVLTHRLQNAAKLYRSKKVSEEVQKLIESTDYSPLTGKIIRIQTFVRSIIAKSKLRKLIMSKSSYDKQYFSKYKKHKALFDSTKSIDCELTRRLGYIKIETASIDKYLSMQYDDFDEKWVEYEKKLQTYLTQEKEFEDWHETKDELGNSYWINHKTLKQSKNHPGIKSFKTNKSKLKAEAEEEQQIQIEIVEHVRQRLVALMNILLKTRNADAKSSRIAELKPK